MEAASRAAKRGSELRKEKVARVVITDDNRIGRNALASRISRAPVEGLFHFHGREAMRFLRHLKSHPGLLAVMGIWLLTGCSTVSSRIQQNPAVFSALSPADQALIRSGQIREAFRPAAVYLAWGRPDQIRRGFRQGHAYEAWIYLQYRSIYTGYYGPWFTRFGPYSYWGYWPGYPLYGPFANPFYDGFITVYVPYRTAFFEGDRCTGWEYTQY
jgi:hypothetical protein